MNEPDLGPERPEGVPAQDPATGPAQGPASGDVGERTRRPRVRRWMLEVAVAVLAVLAHEGLRRHAVDARLAATLLSPNPDVGVLVILEGLVFLVLRIATVLLGPGIVLARIGTALLGPRPRPGAGETRETGESRETSGTSGTGRGRRC